MENPNHYELHHNEAEQQYEFHIGDQIAFVEYSAEGKKIYLTHTEVPPAFEGHGIGSALIEKTLQQIKKKHQILIPLCSFVAHYVDNHPEWQSLLSEGYQM